jgi:hypothetical protein
MDCLLCICRGIRYKCLLVWQALWVAEGEAGARPTTPSLRYLRSFPRSPRSSSPTNLTKQTYTGNTITNIIFHGGLVETILLNISFQVVFSHTKVLNHSGMGTRWYMISICFSKRNSKWHTLMRTLGTLYSIVDCESVVFVVGLSPACAWWINGSILGFLSYHLIYLVSIFNKVILLFLHFNLIMFHQIHFDYLFAYW